MHFGVLLPLLPYVAAHYPQPQTILSDLTDTSECQRTKVAILGAGISGIAAAQALANESIHDFIIIDRNDYLGGRVKHATFGSKPDGSPYTVEMGANWVQGLHSPDGENPIWTLAKKYNINSAPWDMNDVTTFDKTGRADYLDLLTEFHKAEEAASEFALNLYEDNSLRSGFRYAGWDPVGDARKSAVDLYTLAWAAATYPESTSLKAVYGSWVRDLTPNASYDDGLQYVTEQRGLNTMFVQEAQELLQHKDSRLLLNTMINKISYSDQGVRVQTANGTCFDAGYAICTFSLGVLQRDYVTWKPALPAWKRKAINLSDMVTYTKIFLQFPETFWDEGATLFLYADEKKRGYYPVLAPLKSRVFANASIMLVIVIAEQAQEVERQTEKETQEQITEVLRTMYPDRQIPEPLDIIYPRWSQYEWAHGSYATWPVSYTPEMYKNLSKNVDNLYFAGEAGSDYPGYMHGAWFSGQKAGLQIIAELQRSEELQK